MAVLGSDFAGGRKIAASFRCDFWAQWPSPVSNDAQANSIYVQEGGWRMVYIWYRALTSTFAAVSNKSMSYSRLVTWTFSACGPLKRFTEERNADAYRRGDSATPSSMTGAENGMPTLCGYEAEDEKNKGLSKNAARRLGATDLLIFAQSTSNAK
jgi:hypothetical protein